MRQCDLRPLSVAVLSSLLVHALALLVWQGLPRGDAFASLTRAAPLPLDARIAAAVSETAADMPKRRAPDIAGASSAMAPLPATTTTARAAVAADPAVSAVSASAQDVAATPPARRALAAGIVAIEPTYYLHTEVDVPPYPLTELSALAASVPGARDVLVPGKVVVELWVDDAGRVARVDVLDTDLPAALVAGLEETLLRQPFTPAIRHGAWVHARIKGELQYAPLQRARIRR
ncbi:hypothetical protein [uncultured Propionivibrio sp.]|uniref:hypothetical protein n=1 Tax=uncultured Propionivibrio sp. TaxID=426737 RepID=UPI0029C03366|nr:hypothetical protein [uncultured Propionivibrio sp.]